MTKTMIALGMAATMLATYGAQAETRDGAYCAALVQKYETYLDNWGRQGLPPQSAEARVAAEKCKAGDTSGVPGLEKALQNAKIDLPPKT